MLVLSVLLFLISETNTKNYAILLNASQYYKNIRHTANIHLFYRILRENGFADDEIIVFTCDDLIHDCRNSKKGHIILPDGEFTVPKFRGRSFTPLSFYNAVMGNNKKLIDMDETSNILIYMCGHGNRDFLKVHNKHFITSTELTNALCVLSRRGINKAFVIIDTCKAATLINREKLPENIVVLFTSKEDQDSISSFSSNITGQMTIDNFPYFFYKHIENRLDTDIIDFVEEMASNYPVESNLIIWPEKRWKICEFFKQTKKKMYCANLSFK
ncbi:Gpi-anchor transamidase [Trachipleistophora hominis]|uniref:Gpi-anchor transamidase n=1 Tax=Trachipleistophora hominis TaxID=72359 RepID=L7JY56_TRAHO|nr:Gpi-anchor transamidase [Trachipleistophora hominis]